MRRRIPETLLISLGVVLRLTMFFNFAVKSGYDYSWHWPVVTWFAQHPFQMPSPSLSVEVYHPPLFYWLAGLLYRIGIYGDDHGNFLSVFCGLGRLALFAWALPRFVPDRRARLVALALAVVLPASLHLDGIASNEGLNNLLALSSIVLLARMLAVPRLQTALAAGLVLGLGILTKLSGLALVGAAGLALTMDLVWHREGRRLLPWLAVAAVVALVSGWYFARNLRLYHEPVLSASECGARTWFTDATTVFNRQPYLKRRPASYFLGWNSDIFLVSPYRPTAVTEKPRFFSALVASTVVDVYFFGFSAARNDRPGESIYGTVLLQLARASALAGTVIALLTASAWFAALVAVWTRRRADLLFLLLVPLVAVLGQMHYAMLYPDNAGPVKGIYMQFAAAPLFALFGLAVSWLWQRRWGRPLAIGGYASVVLIAAYTFACRFA